MFHLLVLWCSLNILLYLFIEEILENTMHRKEEEKETHNLPAEILTPPRVLSCDSKRG